MSLNQDESCSDNECMYSFTPTKIQEYTLVVYGRDAYTQCSVCILTENDPTAIWMEFSRCVGTKDFEQYLYSDTTYYVYIQGYHEAVGIYDFDVLLSGCVEIKTDEWFLTESGDTTYAFIPTYSGMYTVYFENHEDYPYVVYFANENTEKGFKDVYDYAKGHGTLEKTIHFDAYRTYYIRIDGDFNGMMIISYKPR